MTRENELKQLIIPKRKMIETLMGDKTRGAKFAATLLQAGLDYNLRNCSTKSIVEAGIAAGMLKLMPGKELGLAYLVPFKLKTGETVCQLQIGYKGYISMLARIGWHLKAYAVYSVDEFDYEINGWEEKLTFKPNYESRQSNPDWIYQNLEKVITIVKSRDGEVLYNIMTKAEIEKIRLKSQNQKDHSRPSGVWFEWYEQMAIKSAIKRHIKRLPVANDDVTVALGLDDIAERGSVPDYQKFQKEAVVVEVDATADAPQLEQPKDVNAMLLSGANVDNNQMMTPEQELTKALMDRGVVRSKALQYAKENAEQANSLLSDLGSLDAVAEEMRG